MSVREQDGAARRLVLTDGTAGRLLERPPWSWQVLDLAGPSAGAWLDEAGHWAAEQGVLDLRAAAPLPGSTPLGPGVAEHVLPVPQRLTGADATRGLGRRVAAVLRLGDLLVLSGPLGAGKTTFTQGLGQALGVRGRVTSPTFVLAREHRGPVPMVHVDAYRLREPGAATLDLDDLGLDTALDDAVTVVEWGEGVVEHLADARLDVVLDRPPPQPDGRVDGDERTAQVRCVGSRWAVVSPPNVTG